MAETLAAPKSVMQRVLDGIERAGNMVPHPVVIFLILIAIVITMPINFVVNKLWTFRSVRRA